MWRKVAYTEENCRKFLLTHPVWDVTYYFLSKIFIQSISTHTSRVGCDRIRFPSYWGIFDNFYSHIPCGMWRTCNPAGPKHWFISTHTSRVGCDDSGAMTPIYYWISTHTSRVGCDALPDACKQDIKISTHTSRVGCDLTVGINANDIMISTHTSRVGCDPVLWEFCWHSKFLLTHPVWDVTVAWRPGDGMLIFLLTHPVWDVTELAGIDDEPQFISTHTSRVGCDAYGDEVTTWNQDFYSHIPCGMWHWRQLLRYVGQWFLLTHPVWDVTQWQHSTAIWQKFLLTHPVWDVTWW